MKRLFCFFVMCIMCLSLCSCKSNVQDVKITEAASDLFSQEDITKAIDAIIKEFDLHWNNCTLKELCYAGDAVTTEFQDFADRYDADEVIVLASEFIVDRADGAASMNVGATYNWHWILVRSDGGEWKHVDHGFY